MCETSMKSFVKRHFTKLKFLTWIYFGKTFAMLRMHIRLRYLYKYLHVFSLFFNQIHGGSYKQMNRMKKIGIVRRIISSTMHGCNYLRWLYAPLLLCSDITHRSFPPTETACCLSHRQFDGSKASTQRKY